MDSVKKINFRKDVLPYLIIFVVILIFKELIIYPVRVSGSSMDNTLKDGDIVILDEISYRFKPIKRGDIVVAREDGVYIIKRVIGIPGDKIKYVDNFLYVNGKKVEEDYLTKKARESTCLYKNNICDGEVSLSDEYYLMGDNRGVSEDSRVVGTFKKSQIKGEAIYRIFPFSRIGKTK